MAVAYLGFHLCTDRPQEPKKKSRTLENASLDVLQEALKPAVQLFTPERSQEFQDSMETLDRCALACAQVGAKPADLSELLQSKRKLLQCLRELLRGIRLKPGGAEFVDVLEDIETCETALENVCYNASQDFALTLESRY
jgi:hypothetical protein